MNNNTVMRVLTFMNQVNEGVFGDSESNKKEIIEFLSSVPDFGDFVEKEKKQLPVIYQLFLQPMKLVFHLM